MDRNAQDLWFDRGNAKVVILSGRHIRGESGRVRSVEEGARLHRSGRGPALVIVVVIVHGDDFQLHSNYPAILEEIRKQSVIVTLIPELGIGSVGTFLAPIETHDRARVRTLNRHVIGN